MEGWPVVLMVVWRDGARWDRDRDRVGRSETGVGHGLEDSTVRGWEGMGLGMVVEEQEDNGLGRRLSM